MQYPDIVSLGIVFGTCFAVLLIVNKTMYSLKVVDVFLGAMFCVLAVGLFGMLSSVLPRLTSNVNFYGLFFLFSGIVAGLFSTVFIKINPSTQIQLAALATGTLALILTLLQAVGYGTRRRTNNGNHNNHNNNNNNNANHSRSN
jgi:hypothetical protein